jgi:hypothetical protein
VRVGHARCLSVRSRAAQHSISISTRPRAVSAILTVACSSIEYALSFTHMHSVSHFNAAEAEWKQWGREPSFLALGGKGRRVRQVLRRENSNCNVTRNAERNCFVSERDW